MKEGEEKDGKEEVYEYMMKEMKKGKTEGGDKEKIRRNFKRRENY